MHPYERIAETYRRRIRDGELRAGERLPTVKALAEEHQVSSATVRHAMSWLQVEGYVVITQRGTWVAESPNAGPSAHDRLVRSYRTGSYLAVGETKRVTSAKLVQPPLYVASLFDIDPGQRVIRREYVTGQGARRTMLAVDWYPEEFAESVPDLLGTEPGAATPTSPGRGNDLMTQIEHFAGRRVTSGRDSMHARNADEREAGLLGLPLEATILAGAHEWSDNRGLITYGEWCLPTGLVIGYQYSIEEPER